MGRDHNAGRTGFGPAWQRTIPLATRDMRVIPSKRLSAKADKTRSSGSRTHQLRDDQAQGPSRTFQRKPRPTSRRSRSEGRFHREAPRALAGGVVMGGAP